VTTVVMTKTFLLADRHIQPSVDSSAITPFKAKKVFTYTINGLVYHVGFAGTYKDVTTAKNTRRAVEAVLAFAAGETDVLKDAPFDEDDFYFIAEILDDEVRRYYVKESAIYRIQGDSIIGAGTGFNEAVLAIHLGVAPEEIIGFIALLDDYTSSAYDLIYF